MSNAQIGELVASFAAAAARCEAGGLHGVEVHCGHGYLLAQFLSPVLNRREDRYGGSAENRLRIIVEILTAIRSAVSASFVLGVRVSESADPRVLALQDVVQAVQSLQRQGLIDYVNASKGDYYRGNCLASAGMEQPTGYQLPSAGQITAATSVARLVTGRFRTLEEIEQTLRDGVADLVSMVRALIADPYLVRKTREGRPQEVRPCIACNQGCLGGALAAGRVGCTVNPAMGAEASMSETRIGRSASPRRVLVVGGGVAGMEAARVAALAGHRVTLAEAHPRLGGTVELIRNAPNLRIVADIASWLESEVYRLGVSVALSTYIEAEEVLAQQPDAVIVATGAIAQLDGAQVASPAERPVIDAGARVLSSIELLAMTRAELGDSALVLDELGHYEAIACAEYLLDRGVAVTFVTRHAQFAPIIENALRSFPSLERLYGKGAFRVVTRAQLVSVHPGEAGIRALESARIERVAADSVALVTYKRSNDALFHALEGRVASVQRVGDALSARDLQAAIRDGHLAARALG
jgi:hypothetical protein